MFFFLLASPNTTLLLSMHYKQPVEYHDGCRRMYLPRCSNSNSAYRQPKERVLLMASTIIYLILNNIQHLFPAQFLQKNIHLIHFTLFTPLLFSYFDSIYKSIYGGTVYLK